jgi:hypothetical protein
MKLHIISDLHLDTCDLDTAFGLDTDFMVIQEDIHKGIKALGFIKSIIQKMPIANKTTRVNIHETAYSQ